MIDSTKLDLILEKLERHELVPEEKRLHELANKYWGLSDHDFKLLELSRLILDQGEGNKDKTLLFLFDLANLVKNFGEDRLLAYLNSSKKS